jgi:VanZ family protein
MSEKKVIAVIVEGPSDENAIGGIIKEFFSSEEVQFAVVHGDITSNELTSVDNVVSKIYDLINKEIREKYGYHFSLFKRFAENAGTRRELIFNIWLFVPLGILLGRISRNPRILLIPFGMSVAIEVSQYVFHIGVCDICDVINNTLGGILGFLAVGAMYVKKRQEPAG